MNYLLNDMAIRHDDLRAVAFQKQEQKRRKFKLSMGKTISRKKRLSQYYTNRDVAELLISSLPSDEASTIIDLSAGEGSLLMTAALKYDNAKLYGIDIDDENCRKLDLLQNT
ncbi:TPA: N-6 DNA methylase, partial [Klebsiella pneumoniae]